MTQGISQMPGRAESTVAVCSGTAPSHRLWRGRVGLPLRFRLWCLTTSEGFVLVNEDRSASFVELFFDLVFVFGVTQVVASIHGHLDWPTLWRAAVVLALMWWAWTQYTWLAGYADFDEVRPRVVLLVATAGTFVLAVAVQGAWADEGPIFGMAYFGVMALAGAFMWLNVLKPYSPE